MHRVPDFRPHIFWLNQWLVTYCVKDKEVLFVLLLFLFFYYRFVVVTCLRTLVVLSFIAVARVFLQTIQFFVGCSRSTVFAAGGIKFVAHCEPYIPCIAVIPFVELHTVAIDDVRTALRSEDIVYTQIYVHVVVHKGFIQTDVYSLVGFHQHDASITFTSIEQSQVSC